MRNYYRVNIPPPAGIDKKNAHIVGGGIDRRPGRGGIPS